MKRNPVTARSRDCVAPPSHIGSRELRSSKVIGSLIVYGMTVLQAEPLLQWSDALKELIGFIALFLGAGGIGFRYFAMRGADMNDAFNSVAARRAAVLGLVGIGLSLVMVWVELPGLAGRKHLAVGAF